MIVAFTKAAIGITVILGGWLIVQTLWRAITGASPGQDPLAGRIGCQSCDCREKCEDTK